MNLYMTGNLEPQLAPLAGPRADALETPAGLNATIAATQRGAELKSTAASIPNRGILIGTLRLQAAKDRQSVHLACHPLACNRVTSSTSPTVSAPAESTSAGLPP